MSCGLLLYGYNIPRSEMSLWARPLLAVVAVTSPAFAQPEAPGSLAHLRLGEAFLQQRDLQSAALEFQQALKGDHEPAWTLVWAHIDLGRVMDATGQRDRAVKEYQFALETKDNTFGARAFANSFLGRAATLDDVAPLPGHPEVFISPAVLSRIDPEYSPEALLARLEGAALIEVSLDSTGAITGLQVLKPLGLGLDEAALAAVRRWTFAPGTEAGQPVAMVTPVPVQFHLPSRVPGWHVKKIEFAEPDGAVRPVLLHAGGFDLRTMPPDLVEEATIDAAMSRIPDATISMEIDTLGTPGKLQANAASLAAWGDDAIRTLGEWRFSPRPSQSAIAVPCVIELVWIAP